MLRNVVAATAKANRAMALAGAARLLKVSYVPVRNLAFGKEVSTVLRRVQLGNDKIDVKISVNDTFVTTISFRYGRKVHTFNIDAWSDRRRGMNRFLERFLSRQPAPDPQVFGNLEDTVKLPTPNQQLVAVHQACEDIMTTVDRILHTHGRSVIDYAIWYRENHKLDPDDEEAYTYNQYITRLACHCIVHSDFMPPDVTYELVEFS